MGNDDFFLGFAAHAHTKNELEIDPAKEEELRRKNSPEKAQRLTEMVLDSLETDISKAGYSIDDVGLLVLYLSYRGESEEKDTAICESVLRTIEKRFKTHSTRNQLRLIGHTTGGELENEDLTLKEISGIGNNGLSLLALVTNLPIGVGRTWGLRTAEEAGEQGREMARDAWVDFNQQATSKEHLHMRKTLLVLTKRNFFDRKSDNLLFLARAKMENDLKNVYVAEFDGKVVGYMAFSQNIHGNEFARAVMVPYYSLSISYFR